MSRQWTKLTPHRLRTLVTCGAAGGIAATFNAPIAGAIFSMEVLIGRVQTDFLLVLLTSLSSCMVARFYLGNYPAFEVPAYDLASGREPPLYFLMAATVGSVHLSHRLSPFSIYTLKLHRRGIGYPGREEADRARERMAASRASTT